MWLCQCQQQHNLLHLLCACRRERKARTWRARNLTTKSLRFTCNYHYDAPTTLILGSTLFQQRTVCQTDSGARCSERKYLQTCESQVQIVMWGALVLCSVFNTNVTWTGHWKAQIKVSPLMKWEERATRETFNVFVKSPEKSMANSLQNSRHHDFLPLWKAWNYTQLKSTVNLRFCSGVPGLTLVAPDTRPGCRTHYLLVKAATHETPTAFPHLSFS